MTSSSATDTEALFAMIQIAARKGLQVEITAFERLRAGGNNQVYKLIASDGAFYVAKVYYQNPKDARDRLDSESRGLAFLRDQGVTAIARPLLVYRTGHFVLYEFVDGRPLVVDGRSLDAGEPTDVQIVECAKFISTLKDLSSKPEAFSLPSASEACYSFDMAEKIVKSRLARFDDFKARDLMDEAMLDFLRNDFKPALKRVCETGAAHLSRAGVPVDIELDVSRRTLSPSDFGFHNALVRPTGELVFLDFEYFGWDDPVKMISDFLLHPAMNLNRHQREVFMKAIIPKFAVDKAFVARFKAMHPLFALKWCLIMLNEFLPDEMGRRTFAKAGVIDQEQARKTQLAKARQMLERVKDDYENVASALS
jgi:thiamine kinase-like enzyme